MDFFKTEFCIFYQTKRGAEPGILNKKIQKDLIILKFLTLTFLALTFIVIFGEI